MTSPTIWRRLAAVLKEAWPTWLALAGVLVTFNLGCLVSSGLANAVRYAGTTLQILGLGTVACGLEKTRSLFNRPSIRASIGGWFRRFAAVFKAPKSISAQGGLEAVAKVRAEGQVVRGVRPGSPLDERVKALEENLNQLRDELDKKAQEVNRELGGLKKDLQQESQERQAADKGVTRQIEEVAIGGIHLEIVGLVWLFLGVLGASLPEEIARLLRVIQGLVT